MKTSKKLLVACYLFLSPAIALSQTDHGSSILDMSSYQLMMEDIKYKLSKTSENSTKVKNEKDSRDFNNIEIKIKAGDFERSQAFLEIYSDSQLLSHEELELVEEKGKLRFRVLHGPYVDGKLNEIIRGKIAPAHEGKTTVTGIEIGKIVYEGFNDWPVNIIAQGGLYIHDDKNFQKNGNGVTAMIKAEYTSFPWNHHVRTKVEFSEGISYVTRVPHFESESVRSKNDGRDSKLLNYLGVGVGFNLGDIINSQEYENCYVGGYVYHRSGIFGSVSAFGNINGGSNFQTLYMECSY